MRKNILSKMLLMSLALPTIVLTSCSTNQSEVSSEQVEVKFVCLDNSKEVYKDTKKYDKDSKFASFTPSITGYTFLGWYTDEDLTFKVDDDFTFTVSTTLYGKVEKISSNKLTSFTSKNSLDFFFTIDLSNVEKTDTDTTLDSSKCQANYAVTLKEDVNGTSKIEQFTKTNDKRFDAEITINNEELSVRKQFKSSDVIETEISFIYNYTTNTIILNYTNTIKTGLLDSSYLESYSFLEITLKEKDPSSLISRTNTATTNLNTVVLSNETNSLILDSSSTLSESSLVQFKDNGTVNFNFIFEENHKNR